MATTKNPAVLWNTAQSLETSEQTQARANIGVTEISDEINSNLHPATLKFDEDLYENRHVYSTQIVQGQEVKSLIGTLLPDPNALQHPAPEDGVVTFNDEGKLVYGNPYYSDKFGKWVGVDSSGSTVTTDTYWRICSFSITASAWALQFEIDMINGRVDNDSYETKTVRIGCATSSAVEVGYAVETRNIPGTIAGDRGYGNVLYYKLDNSKVTIYIKSQRKTAEVLLTRLTKVTNAQNISNLAWYLDKNAPTQPTSPVQFSPDVGNLVYSHDEVTDWNDLVETGFHLVKSQPVSVQNSPETGKMDCIVTNVSECILQMAYGEYMQWRWRSTPSSQHPTGEWTDWHKAMADDTEVIVHYHNNDAEGDYNTIAEIFGKGLSPVLAVGGVDEDGSITAYMHLTSQGECYYRFSDPEHKKVYALVKLDPGGVPVTYTWRNYDLLGNQVILDWMGSSSDELYNDMVMYVVDSEYVPILYFNAALKNRYITNVRYTSTVVGQTTYYDFYWPFTEIVSYTGSSGTKYTGEIHWDFHVYKRSSTSTATYVKSGTVPVVLNESGNTWTSNYTFTEISDFISEHLRPIVYLDSPISVTHGSFTSSANLIMSNMCKHTDGKYSWVSEFIQPGGGGILCDLVRATVNSNNGNTVWTVSAISI